MRLSSCVVRKLNAWTTKVKVITSGAVEVRADRRPVETRKKGRGKCRDGKAFVYSELGTVNNAESHQEIREAVKYDSNFFSLPRSPQKKKSFLITLESLHGISCIVYASFSLWNHEMSEELNVNSNKRKECKCQSVVHVVCVKLKTE